MPQRAPSELSAYHKKTFQIDDHVGITISGLTADARTLSRFMQTECMNHKYAYDVKLPVSRLVTTVSNRTLAALPPSCFGLPLSFSLSPFHMQEETVHRRRCCLPLFNVSCRAAAKHNRLRSSAIRGRDARGGLRRL